MFKNNQIFVGQFAYRWILLDVNTYNVQKHLVRPFGGTTSMDVVGC